MLAQGGLGRSAQTRRQSPRQTNAMAD